MEVSASVICFVFHVIMLSNEVFVCVCMGGWGGGGGGEERGGGMKSFERCFIVFHSDLSDKFWMDA